MGKTIADVAVIGTVFVDVKGFSANTYDPLGRNIGEVQIFHGGVGRNVAETIAQLDVKTSFISTVDHGGLAQEVLDRLRRYAIDTTYVQARDQGMGMWMAILDESGNLAGSISQMPSLPRMEEVILAQLEQVTACSKHIVLEIDLNETIAERVIHAAHRQNIPVFALPGNLDVLSKRLDLLAFVQCFVCNDIEAAKLSKTKLETEKDVELAAEFFLEQGVRQQVITLGEKGCYYVDRQTGEKGFLPANQVYVADTTGAGDSFFAGTVASLVRGKRLKEAVSLGTEVAAITISVAESTCQNLKERLGECQTPNG